jgi:hypothetical protein
MSLLAELEELQRCLEGTADSDSEDASNLAAPTADSKTSEKEDVSSLANRNEREPTGLVQDSVPRHPLHAETVCKNSNVKEVKIVIDTADVVVGKFSEQSVANSDKIESAAQVSRAQTSSQESSANKGHTSINVRQEVTTVEMVTMKNVLQKSGMMPANVSRSVADGKVSRDKILVDVCTKKDSPSKDFKTSTLRRDELKAPSKSEDVKILVCKVPDTSA